VKIGLQAYQYEVLLFVNSAAGKEEQLPVLPSRYCAATGANATEIY